MANPKYLEPDTIEPPLIDEEGEVRELTEKDFARAVPFSALPESLQQKLLALKKPRGPQKEPTKERITIRLSPEVVSHFRESGRGWQSRMDAALKEWMNSQSRVRNQAKTKTARHSA
ncbi:BrnA antitoxin family protein [Silvibacterium dinghuense]|uniref:BrnA antitoxin family protein n=1 Tax=Silvibacterium dinghuense TaxID=1560006 RepID=A0A4Q1SHZ8_9BACT|nr:BrnA antitoxin family protein [Silvibacterium dinghuense]RXS97231.1 hypothetical protein ESZ00_04775 [Silvibacterium dinghuense]GGG97291.1 hypothetical protein GCM10011586_10710 [Silvibacterium dinghuense]